MTAGHSAPDPATPHATEIRSRGPMFAPVAAKPDLVAIEHEMLALWRERRTFERLRAQNAGRARWSFLDGPITANNPMGVHHAWGRTYKDLYCRFFAMLGHDERWQNGFDCQGLWVEVNVERDLGFTSKRDIEAFGMDRFVSLCKQRVLTYAARQTEQSIRLGYWMDWNDPDELRRLRDLLADDPSQQVTVEGPAGPVTDSVEMIVGRLGTRDIGGSYFTFSNENNDLIWGFLAECHRRGWLYKGHDSMPWCPRCGTGLSQMEMSEGYADREDPGLTVRLPLLDRPGEALLVWTTTPWTLTANVAAAVGPDLRYVLVRQGDDAFWVGRSRLSSALVGSFEVVEERSGAEMVGWRYRGPFDDLPAVAAAFAAEGYEHRVIPWAEVGEEEGTSIVHIAPGCGAEDYQLGTALDLPIIGPIDEDGIYYDGFGWLSGREAPAVAEAIIDDLQQRGVFYHLEPYSHRYPHCWRCGTPLLFRLVDEWFISMGPVYDTPRDELTAAQVDASLRYQIMEVVDQIRWFPDFGYDRELAWLREMRDWMISKKRYWGLALPIYDCAACGTVQVIGGREELRERAIEGWDAFEGHTPHRPFVDAVKIACSGCGAPVERIPDVGNPWLDAGIVPFSTIHFREDPEYWAKWYPADFITESFPGQFRNWFYAMLAMGTVLRREPPFKAIFGYALLFGEDGRPMHKSWGNAIDFDEAAERMGVDVMRWIFAGARPDDNINFGWHTADEARRELLVLWNVYAFLVTYAGLADWRPGGATETSTNVLDRWILSRAAATAEIAEDRLRDFDALRATEAISTFIGDLSTWYLRLSRERMRRADDDSDRAAAFATLHAALVGLLGMLAPILPFVTEAMYQNLVTGQQSEAPDSVHLTAFPNERLAGHRDRELERSMAIARRAVELIRKVRSQAGIRLRQPLGRAWLAMPAGTIVDREALLAVIADDANIVDLQVIDDESDLVDRRVKPLLPRIGRSHGPRIPAIMAAAKAGEFEIQADGSVTLAGVTLSPDEVEILAQPRAGTAVAHDEGLVAIIDTELTSDLIAAGDARELARSIFDLRREAGLALDDLIELWVDGLPSALESHLPSIAEEVSAATVHRASPPAGVATTSVDLAGGALTVGLRAVPAGPDGR